MPLMWTAEESILLSKTVKLFNDATLGGPKWREVRKHLKLQGQLQNRSLADLRKEWQSIHMLNEDAI